MSNGKSAPENENPGALAGATGANVEAANFWTEHYPATALRFQHLCHRLPITADQAALLAGLAFGEVRA